MTFTLSHAPPEPRSLTPPLSRVTDNLYILLVLEWGEMESLSGRIFRVAVSDRTKTIASIREWLLKMT